MPTRLDARQYRLEALDTLHADDLPMCRLHNRGASMTLDKWSHYGVYPADGRQAPCISTLQPNSWLRA